MKIRKVYYMRYTIRNKWVYQLLSIKETGMSNQLQLPCDQPSITPEPSTRTTPIIHLRHQVNTSKHTRYPNISSSPAPPLDRPQNGAGKS